MQELKETDETINPKWIIIDGIPKLRQNQDYQQYAKALEEAANLIAKANTGSKISPIVYIPYDKKVSKHSEDIIIDGSGFIEFGSVEDAKEFSKNYRNLPCSLQGFLSNLQCYTSNDINNLESLDDEYEKLTRDEFQSDRNLLWWLLDNNNEDGGGERYADQYVIRYQGTEFEETNVFWMDENEVKEGRSLCYDASDLKADRREMTRQYVKWSPNGYYLLTTHPQGIQLWGGQKWKNFQKLAHHRVDEMNFSPNETFLITCNSGSYENASGQRQNPQCKIWDVLMGQEIISVPYTTIGPSIKLRLPGWWPIFKWSYDEEYIAKINSSRGMNAKAKDLNKINIFQVCKKENPDGDEIRFRIEKLGGKSLSVDSLFNIDFSPTENILAYTTFAQNDDQAKVTLLSIPSKNSLRVQTLGFDVKKAHLYWQSQGRYLAINMAHSQSKSNILIKSHSIGIMTIKDKNMPFSRTEKLGIITYFCWEPSGDRFAVIHGGTKRIEPNVTIYRVQNNMRSVKILELPKRRCNELYWAPEGGRLIIANVDKTRRAGGELEFIDISKLKYYNKGKNVIKNNNIVGVKVTHENMTDLQWCPSGRYVITATTQYLQSTSGDDTRYVVWSYQGDKLFEKKIKYFYQVLWRPTPNKLLKLTHSDKQKINNKLSNGWHEMFTKFDNQKKMKAVGHGLDKNVEKKKKYDQIMNGIKKKQISVLQE
eukprot:491464_1